MVGAPGDDTYGTNSGAVYLYRKENGIWILKSKLTARIPAPSDYFGHQVAIAGNMQMVLAAATGSNSDEVDSGAVYIFGT